MRMIKKSITVTGQQAEWIKAQTETGHYGNESEYIRDLIRREQTRSVALLAIQQALIDGENSGISQRTPEQIRQAAQQEMRKHGKL